MTADHDLLERDPDLVYSELDGETVMLSITHGRYFGLNPVASRVWQLLAAPTRLADLRRQLLLEYEVGDADCERDLNDFVAESLRLGLIRLCQQP